MKVNGVKHVGVAPYNVASNGMGERMVQSFKNCTKACKGSKLSIQSTPGGSSLIWLPNKYLQKGYTLNLMSILN